MNVFTVYGATEYFRMPSLQIELRGLVTLSYYTFERIDKVRKLNAEIIAGRCLQHVRR